MNNPRYHHQQLDRVLILLLSQQFNLRELHKSRHNIICNLFLFTSITVHKDTVSSFHALDSGYISISTKQQKELKLKTFPSASCWSNMARDMQYIKNPAQSQMSLLQTTHHHCFPFESSQAQKVFVQFLEMFLKMARN